MKQYIVGLSILLGAVCSISGQESVKNHPRGLKVQPVLEALSQNGAPGSSLAILDKDGWWMGSSGYSSLEKKEKMTNEHLHYLQSVAKTYMGVATLKLYEEGRLQLEEPITKYLGPAVSNMISRADEITIKMLLNHTSGVPEYNFAPEYATNLLQHPEKPFEPIDYISYIKGKNLDFSPGSKYSYRNTNYVLLAIIVDEITGDHGQYIEDTIFKPLGLQHTYYQISSTKLRGEKIPESYWDRYSDGLLENVSFVQQQNVTYMVGDDGVVTSTQEAIVFLKSLLEGRLLKPETLKLMTTWVNNSEGKPRYGLGLAYNNIAGKVAYGHTGGGLGAGCELRYFPEEELYVFVAINIGTVTYSPLHEKLIPIRDRIYEVLVE